MGRKEVVSDVDPIALFSAAMSKPPLSTRLAACLLALPPLSTLDSRRQLFRSGIVAPTNLSAPHGEVAQRPPSHWLTTSFPIIFLPGSNADKPTRAICVAGAKPSPDVKKCCSSLPPGRKDWQATLRSKSALAAIRQSPVPILSTEAYSLFSLGLYPPTPGRLYSLPGHSTSAG